MKKEIKATLLFIAASIAYVMLKAITVSIRLIHIVSSAVEEVTNTLSYYFGKRILRLSTYLTGV